MIFLLDRFEWMALRPISIRHHVPQAIMFRIETSCSFVSIRYFVNVFLIRYYPGMNDDPLHNLLVCIARALQSEQRQQAVGAGLLPVQWAILSYLRDANRFSNTPQALAEFLAQTKGTVSQSLKLLESHGWISRDANPVDRRSVRLALTESGRARLGESSGSEWPAVLDCLTPAQRANAEATLARLLAEWQHSRGGRTFGVCRSCRHFRAGESDHRCGLTGETLTHADSALICREHEAESDLVDDPAQGTENIRPRANLRTR
jgi:MarR family transcriptional regulator, negative regulator of the multidrug operon emrRAB